MVDADLRKNHRVEQIQLVLQELSCIRESCLSFITRFGPWLRRPMRSERPPSFRVQKKSSQAGADQIAEKSAQSDIAIASPEITESTAAFASMFSAVRVSKQINLSDAERATLQIIDSISQKGLAAWLDDVRRYHEGTFQHCLLVTEWQSLCVGNRVL